MSAIIILSGGLDSSVALAWAKRNFSKLSAVNFQYGSNHQQMESAMARKQCELAGISLQEIRLDFFRNHFESSLLGGAVPEGEYNARNMASTVVPFRNGIMMSICAGIAESQGYRNIILANHAGDHHLYPDCRATFIESMNEAIVRGTDGKVRLLSPFCANTKTEIVKLGALLSVDFSQTYSCYKGGATHCGKCATCQERKQAFRDAGIKDPTIYSA